MTLSVGLEAQAAHTHLYHSSFCLSHSLQHTQCTHSFDVDLILERAALYRALGEDDIALAEEVSSSCVCKTDMSVIKTLLCLHLMLQPQSCLQRTDVLTHSSTLCTSQAHCKAVFQHKKAKQQGASTQQVRLTSILAAVCGEVKVLRSVAGSCAFLGGPVIYTPHCLLHRPGCCTKPSRSALSNAAWPSELSGKEYMCVIEQKYRKNSHAALHNSATSL